jgi:uncharacterized protein YbjT (DUF2867 family)
MGNTILVTGATGNVGAEVVNQLLARGEPVRVAARNLDKARAKAQSLGWDAAEFVLLDYHQPATMAPAFQGVDRLFLMATLELPDVKAAMLPMIDAARAAGVRHVAMHTGMGIDYDGSSSARQAEVYLEASGMGYTFLRPNWFMQNFNLFFLPDIKREGGITMPAGDGKISFIDIRDIAAVGVAALTEEGHHGKGYTLTGGQALDHHEVAAILSHVAEKSIAYTPLSEEAARAMWQAAGWPAGNIEVILQIFRPVRAGRAATIFPDVAEVLGRPATTFAQYAQDYAHIWR